MSRKEGIRVTAWPAFRNRRDNPYNWLLYTNLGTLGVKVDEFSVSRLLLGVNRILHLHWPDHQLNRRNGPEAAARAGMLLLLLYLARRRGIRTIWTAHNIHSHEAFHPRLEKPFWKLFTGLLNGAIYLSEEGRRSALECLPRLAGVPGFVIPHGHYRGVYPNDVDRTEAREILGITPNQRVITFVGQIRPYKNLPGLLASFRGHPDPDAILVVAGQPSTRDHAREVIGAAQADSRVRLFLHFIPDPDLQRYLNAADLVVLPYEKVLNSGSAVLALSYDRPVLLPAVPSLSELQQQVGVDWVRTYSPPLTSDDLAAGLAWARHPGRSARAPLEMFDWGCLAELTIAAYEQVLEHPRTVSARS